MNILVINSGSSSVKYQLIDPVTGVVLLVGKKERLQEGGHQQAIEQLLEDVRQFDIAAVGHRVVHGGDSFHDATLIDDAVLATIEEWVPLAPLHNPHNLSGIRGATTALPGVPQVAVFDTAFHARMPRRAHCYAIDTEIAAKHRIRRYGFHGTSHQYVANKAAQFLKRPLDELRIISLHLGNGASACAIELGHSTDTSMGMTPLEGLVMGTRAGDVDAGVLLHLLRQEGFDSESLDQLLNMQSGLKGLSGLSNDLREIEKQAGDGNDHARLAINVFVHRVRKYIGAYAAVMGGVDAIVITGGIGENSASMRRRILQRFGFLGVLFDEDRNHDATLSADTPVVRISSDSSRVQVLAVQTNEELMIAKQTADIVRKQKDVIRVKSIPIAVSARHLHLDKETFAILFGDDVEPTRYKDLSQPGQYACEERVSLIGPRNRIDGVRLLGPLRSKNQVEVSRTDEYFLGVDAPVRNSGQVKDSAPIIVEGPKGKVQLTEGLICAHRHIHMHPDDAKAFGVKNKDEVEVAITGGPRDLVFGDVLVRVSSGYRLEMHIDTDEANAAELSRGADGDLVYVGVNDAFANLQQKHTSFD